MRQHFYQGIDLPPKVSPIITIGWEFERAPTHVAKRHRRWHGAISDPYVPVFDPTVPIVIKFVEEFSLNMEILKHPRKRRSEDIQPSDMGTAGFAVPPLFIDHVTYSNLNPPPIHGELNTTDHLIGNYEPGSTAIILFPDLLYLIPIIIPYDVFIKELGVYITTPGVDDDAIRLGIYSIERGVVEQLLQENIANARTVGYRGLEMNIHVPAGAYALALLTNSSILQVRKAEVKFSLLGSLVHDWQNASTCWTQSSTFSFSTGLDDPPVGIELSDRGVPRILAKVG